VVEEIRNKLDRATGELLESFVNFDKKMVLKFQTGLHAIHSAQKDKEDKINLHTICNHDELEKLLTEHGINKEHFEKVPDVINQFENDDIQASEALSQLPELLQDAIEKVNSKTRDIYEVPASGMIAVTLNLISDNIKDALLAGRAGERTFKAIESVIKGTPPGKKQTVFEDRLYDFGSTKPARPYIDLELDLRPRYVTAAKAANHLADLLEGAAMLSPEVSKDEYVKESLDAYKFIARKILLKSSSNLKKSGIKTASSNIKTLADYIAEQYDECLVRNLKEAVASIKLGLGSAFNTLELNRKLTSLEAEDFENLMKKRLQQVEALESF
jgi:hemerythrin-like domain-containing protein